MNTELQALLADNKHVSLSDTNQRYGSPGEPLPLLIVNNKACEAVISLYGAQVLEFNTAEGRPLLWLSPNAIFEQGRSIRGGIPVCLPWFGAHPTDASKPNHGFARDRFWQVASLRSVSDQQTEIKLTFRNDQPETLALLDQPFTVTMTLQFDRYLDMHLHVKNESEQALPFSWALHSYHPVTNIHDTAISGLSGTQFVDKVANRPEATQEGQVKINGVIDNVYEKVPYIQTITTASDIHIEGSNCDTAIVWNPGPELCEQMNDLPDDAYQQFVCLERGAAFADSWNIEPGAAQTASIKISD